MKADGALSGQDWHAHPFNFDTPNGWERYVIKKRFLVGTILDNGRVWIRKLEFDFECGCDEMGDPWGCECSSPEKSKKRCSQRI